MEQLQKIEVSEIKIEDSKRNFGRRGLKQAVCDECGAKLYTLFSYTKGRQLLCSKCKEEKIRKMFK